MNECLIFNENCLETMKRMPAGLVDLVVTSPPYDNLRSYNGYSFDFEKIAQGLFKIVKHGGVVVWVVGDATVKGSETGTSFRQALYFKEIGFNLHDTMIYGKNSYMPHGGPRYEQAFEFMFVLSKGSIDTLNKLKIPCKTAGTKRFRGNEKAESGVVARDERTTVKSDKPRGNVWFYNVGHNTASAHSAPFPYQLAEDHILSWSNPDQLVYDPFMGSGTTAEAALKNRRNVIGSEISFDYCRIIEDRLKDIEADKTFYYETSA